MESPKNKILVDFCLPIYNEEKIIEESTKKLFHFLSEKEQDFNWQITLVINGTTDKSIEISQKLTKQFPKKIKAINISEPGRGQALKKYWLESQGDILAYMDIDLAVSLNNITDLINPIINKGYQMVVGSRLLAESKIKRSFIRELSSQTYNLLSRMILNHHFSDMQCGFKAIKKNVFTEIAPYIKDNNWFFDTEIIILVKSLKEKIKEIPVDWQENRYDKRKSKVKLFRDSLKFIKNLILFRIRLIKITRELKNRT